MSTTFERVQKIVAEFFDIDESRITEASSLTNDFGADSLDIVELIMISEETFLIEIDDDEALAWDLVGDVVRSVDRMVAEQGRRRMGA